VRLVVYLPEHAEDQENNCADDSHVEIDYPEPFPLRVDIRVSGSASGDLLVGQDSRRDRVGNSRLVENTDGTEKQW
jgi:hypothetical protein